MTPSRNTRSYTLRSVPSSPGRSFFTQSLPGSLSVSLLIHVLYLQSNTGLRASRVLGQRVRERQSRASIRLQGQAQGQGQGQAQGQGQRTRAQGRRVNQGRRTRVQLTPQQRRQRGEERLRQSLAMLAGGQDSNQGGGRPWLVGQREERLGRRPQAQRAPAREAGRLPQPEEVAFRNAVSQIYPSLQSPLKVEQTSSYSQ